MTAPLARPERTVPANIVRAAIVGNAVEGFDFIAWSVFAVPIGHAFFPARSAVASLLLSVATFGAGFVSRPVGALVVGAIADRRGRRPAMLVSLALMGTGTLAIAGLPTYRAIGVAAPLLLVVARLLQGLGFGAEIGPTTAFLHENAPPGATGRAVSWQPISQSIAFLAAAVVGTLTRLALGAPATASWGWRVPFVLGLALVPVGLWLRRAIPVERASAGRVVTDDALRPAAGTVAAAILLLISGTVNTYFLAYVTTFGVSALRLDDRVALVGNLGASAVGLVVALAVRRALDGRYLRPINVWSRVALAVSVWPALALVRAVPTPAVFIAVFAFLSALGAVASTAFYALVVGRFPRRMRATGFGLLYAGTIALFGGTAQVVFTALIARTGNPAAPAFYLAAVNGAAAAAAYALGSRKRVATHGAAACVGAAMDEDDKR